MRVTKVGEIASTNNEIANDIMKAIVKRVMEGAGKKEHACQKILQDVGLLAK